QLTSHHHRTGATFSCQNEAALHHLRRRPAPPDWSPCFPFLFPFLLLQFSRNQHMMADVGFVLSVLSRTDAAHVESSRRHGPSDDDNKDDDNQFQLFVFGDGFADVGNDDPKKKDKKDVTTRAWYKPYGTSDEAHGNKPTGRLSDGLVQSDFLAKILGMDESPPAERLRGKKGVDPSGMNFAVCGAGAYIKLDEDPVPTFGEQIDSFRRLVKHDIIDRDLNGSVALVAFSGSADYAGDEFRNGEVTDVANNVTDKIAEGVHRLLDLGVEKVLVNLLPPLGCRPWFTRADNYTGGCDAGVQTISVTHNTDLKWKLPSSMDDVLLLDMHDTFSKIIHSGTADYTDFKSKYAPCCDSVDEYGYCGQEGKRGKRKYTLCRDPDEYFFWDYYYPTQAGWKAVMDEHEDAIKEFLDI
ncbi:hypothetical protein EJB05_11683, partial [Eragrostis curvula]